MTTSNSINVKAQGRRDGAGGMFAQFLGRIF
jgi:hypothetical protein